MNYITENITDHGGGERDTERNFKLYTEIKINRAKYCGAYSSHLWPEEGTRSFFYDKRFKSRFPSVAFPRHKSSTNE